MGVATQSATFKPSHLIARAATENMLIAISPYFALSKPWKPDMVLTANDTTAME